MKHLEAVHATIKHVSQSAFSKYALIATLVLIIGLSYFLYSFYSQNTKANTNIHVLQANLATNQQQLASVSAQLKDLQSQNQYTINQALEKKITVIETTYKKSVSDYQNLLDLKLSVKDTSALDKEYAQAISYLASTNYASADATLTDISTQIAAQQQKLAAAAGGAPTNATASNAAPGSGFSQQSVSTDRGNFVVDIIAGDISTTKVIVDSASDSDCSNNCPTLPLADYVSRNGAFAGINGSFFCPADYPSCAGKTGSFDTLLMNVKKHYFNSDNNVYSTVPAYIFADSYVRYVSQSLQWGRDTGPNGVIAMQPGLVNGNQIVFNGSDDPKFGSKGARNFVANKGNTVYIGTIFNATMEDSAHVLKTLGMDNAMNLDEGGSTALWFGGYKVGPGRNIPNAILFIRK